MHVLHSIGLKFIHKAYKTALNYFLVSKWATLRVATASTREIHCASWPPHNTAHSTNLRAAITYYHRTHFSSSSHDSTFFQWRTYLSLYTVYIHFQSETYQYVSCFAREKKQGTSSLTKVFKYLYIFFHNPVLPIFLFELNHIEKCEFQYMIFSRGVTTSVRLLLRWKEMHLKFLRNSLRTRQIIQPVFFFFHFYSLCYFWSRRKEEACSNCFLRYIIQEKFRSVHIQGWWP